MRCKTPDIGGVKTPKVAWLQDRWGPNVLASLNWKYLGNHFPLSHEPQRNLSTRLFPLRIKIRRQSFERRWSSVSLFSSAVVGVVELGPCLCWDSCHLNVWHIQRVLTDPRFDNGKAAPSGWPFLFQQVRAEFFLRVTTV